MMKRLVYIILILTCILFAGCQKESIPESVSYDNVNAINSEAQALFENEKYAEALEQYSEAMKLNPVDMDSVLGAVKCQIALEDYTMANTNLSAAVSINPKETEIYNLYLELSKSSENIRYARTVVSLAQRYDIDDILKMIPESPTFNYSDGSYDAKFEVVATAPAGAEIYITERKNSSRTSYQYTDPIVITRGNTTLEAYCVKDGIPSETVEVNYACDYPPVEVSFADPIIERLVRLTLDNEYGPITDVDCESVTQLEQYVLRNNGMDWEEYDQVSVSSFDDLYLLPNLQSLFLENVKPGIDYSALNYCKKLYNLSLSNCGITDISFLKNMTYLGYLGLDGNNISDLSPLLDFEDLYKLDISVANIQDLSIMENWPNLEYLNLSGCGNADLSFISHLTYLKHLNLSAYDYSNNDYYRQQTPIRDISFITNLPNLERLYLYGLEDYSQVSLVKSLTNLNYLYVRTLNYSPMPDDLAKDLQRSLPNCSINY